MGGAATPPLLESAELRNWWTGCVIDVVVIEGLEHAVHCVQQHHCGDASELKRLQGEHPSWKRTRDGRHSTLFHTRGVVLKPQSEKDRPRGPYCAGRHADKLALASTCLLVSAVPVTTNLHKGTDCHSLKFD